MDPIDVITNRNIRSVRVKWIRVLTEECLTSLRVQKDTLFMTLNSEIVYPV